MAAMSFITETLSGFSRHKATQVAAATTYFTIFSLPVILVTIIWLAGRFLGTDATQVVLYRQLQPLLGGLEVKQVQVMIHNVRAQWAGSTLSIVLAIAIFMYGLVGTFLQLQRALNAAWEVQPDLKKGGWARFVAKRLLSVLLVGAAAFLMLVFFAASVVLSSFGHLLRTMLPADAAALILWGSNWLVSVGAILLLAAAMFKIIPDARVRWTEVWLGAIVASVLFNAGKYLIALVVSRFSSAGVFGAAGSVIVLMIWINVSMMILLLGAEIVRVSARRRGKSIQPDGGAVRVQTEK
ncbi:MAG TPA: YihY/virulence factor BrkB family protein, partial [Spirochaetia bacterium]|nr:YihY/virulence factor BrkB family protein [Spirochaetia bacterium]